MEEHGHIVTGMNNQIVWGMPHVFAIFLIVAASGVLNVASIGSVFGKAAYKARAPLSGLLCLALLAGGLTVLMLDLGRPGAHDRRRDALQLHVGLRLERVPLLGHVRDRRRLPVDADGAADERATRGAVGLAAFVWRIVLTTGTGSIFAFLVARQAYGTALLPPMFIVMSFAWGLAVVPGRAGGAVRLERAGAAGATSHAPHAQPARRLRRRRRSTSRSSIT